jgi:hypothetical protein
VVAPVVSGHLIFFAVYRTFPHQHRDSAIVLEVIKTVLYPSTVVVEVFEAVVEVFEVVIEVLTVVVEALTIVVEVFEVVIEVLTVVVEALTIVVEVLSGCLRSVEVGAFAPYIPQFWGTLNSGSPKMGVGGRFERKFAAFQTSSNSRYLSASRYICIDDIIDDIDEGNPDALG